MTQYVKEEDRKVVRAAITALHEQAVNAESMAGLLANVDVAVLDENFDEISDALFRANPAMAVRLLNALPPAFTRKHAQSYVNQLEQNSDPSFAAGAFVAFKARNVKRTQIVTWTLDKALWKWMRRSTNEDLETVIRHLGYDWGTLWADHVAVVYGSGRISRRLKKAAEHIAH